MITDTYRHKGLRNKLAEELRGKGITDEKVLEAIKKVPRHIFFTNEFQHFSYEDKAFPIAENQTISQPFTVAFQTQLLDIKEGERVLEIGTGSGYQCAVLCNMNCEVFSMEYFLKLHRTATKILSDLSLFPQLFHGDGMKGLPEFSPFDKILVTAGAKSIPEELLKQLKVDGLLVIPQGTGDDLEMLKIKKNLNGTFSTTKHGVFRFVPLIGS